MDKDKQIMLGIAIGVFILLLQVFSGMIHNYMDTRIIATDYVPYGELTFYTDTIKDYMDKGYNCEYQLHWLSGGGYSRGDDYCHNENETIHISWDFDNNREVEDFFYN